jgi:hypothetical protein
MTLFLLKSNFKLVFSYVFMCFEIFASHYFPIDYIFPHIQPFTTHNFLSTFFDSEYFTNKRHEEFTYPSPKHPTLFHRNFQITYFSHAVPLVY